MAPSRSGWIVVRPLLPNQSGPQSTSARSQTPCVASEGVDEVVPVEAVLRHLVQHDRDTGFGQARLDHLGDLRVGVDVVVEQLEGHTLCVAAFAQQLLGLRRVPIATRRTGRG